MTSSDEELRVKTVVVPPMSTINWSTQAYGISVPMSEHVCRDYHIDNVCWHLRKKNSGEQGAFLNNNEYQKLRALTDSFGIPQVYGLFYHQGSSVLLREYIQGKTLSVLLIKTTLSMQEKIHYLLALASIITLCHQKGVVHGDLKPNNIVVGEKGLSLIDFGASGWLGDNINEKNYLSYTPSFSHPRLCTSTGEFTPILDWYSYLVICYVTLFGALPKKYSSQAVNLEFSSNSHGVSDKLVHLHYDFYKLFDSALIPSALLSVLKSVY